MPLGRPRWVRHAQGKTWERGNAPPSYLSLEPGPVSRGGDTLSFLAWDKWPSQSFKFIGAGGTWMEGGGDSLPQGNPGGAIGRIPFIFKLPRGGCLCCKG